MCRADPRQILRIRGHIGADERSDFLGCSKDVAIWQPILGPNPGNLRIPPSFIALADSTIATMMPKKLNGNDPSIFVTELRPAI